MKKHYYWLDLLRFVAAFAVLAAHYRGSFFVEYGLLPDSQKNLFTTAIFFFTRLGEESVLFFFVLSGFLVGGKSIERILMNKVNLKSYMMDRVVRIMLPLIASVILTIIIDLITGQQIPYVDILGSIFSLQGIFTGTYNNSPLWSLSYEVWFYVFMGCIMAMCRVQHRKTLILSFLILTITILIFSLKLDAKYLFIWLMGAFAYFLPQSNHSISKAKIFLLSGLLLIAIVISQTTSDTRSISVGISFLNKNFTSILLAFITCLFIHNIIKSVPKTKFGIKVETIGSKLSTFSYSLYLTHYPLISLLTYCGFPKSNSINFKSVALYVLEIIIALIVGYLVYLSSEKHTNTIKRKLGNWNIRTKAEPLTTSTSLSA
jgi:peptidoglycan/LPS O-acetylase OafA/YrhL